VLEPTRKVFVVVLARVDEYGFDFGMMLRFANEGSDLGEIWTRGHDFDDSYAATHPFTFSVTPKG
jgi:hypothetical protein